MHIPPGPQPVSVDENQPIAVSMRAGDWQRVLWAIGKQPLEVVLPMYNQIQAQMVQAVMQARQQSPEPGPGSEVELEEKGN